MINTLRGAPQPASAPREGETPYPVRVSDNRRHLIDQHGKPFFYLGDTAWEQAERRGEMLSYDEALVYARQAAGIDGAGADSQALTSHPLHRS